MADKARAVRIVANGLKGPITVSGRAYNNAMPKQGLPEHEIAEVLNFVRNNFGNRGESLSTNDVQAALSEAKVPSQ